MADADTWATLALDDEDVDELVREADPDELVRFIAERLDREKKTLWNRPAWLVACLERIGNDAAFEILWSTWYVDGVDDGGTAANGLFARWLARHPALGWGRMARLAHAGDELALHALGHYIGDHRATAFDHVAAALGDADARALWARVGL